MNFDEMLVELERDTRQQPAVRALGATGELIEGDDLAIVYVLPSVRRSRYHLTVLRGAACIVECAESGLSIADLGAAVLAMVPGAAAAEWSVRSWRRYTPDGHLGGLDEVLSVGGYSRSSLRVQMHLAAQREVVRP